MYQKMICSKDPRRRRNGEFETFKTVPMYVMDMTKSKDHFGMYFLMKPSIATNLLS
jgi:hypothetical protein